jgi:SAM-dependent methyltransferase
LNAISAGWFQGASQLAIWVRSTIKKLFDPLLSTFDLQVIRNEDTVDYYLHSYNSYKQYRDTQIAHNIRKLTNVWADDATLDLMCEELRKDRPNQRIISGICHGTRNGFEQNHISSRDGFEAIGTDISETAKNFERSVHWDFHNENPDWVGKFDFVYSNSLDQSWNPRSALVTWLNQLRPDGTLVIEHTDAHGPSGASEMDPFGVKPRVMPYVLIQWFGTDISIRFVESTKSNNEMKVWLFFVRKNVETVI